LFVIIVLGPHYKLKYMKFCFCQVYKSDVMVKELIKKGEIYTYEYFFYYYYSQYVIFVAKSSVRNNLSQDLNANKVEEDLCEALAF